jgi:tetratricopeptide (TPR) repeat protein
VNLKPGGLRAIRERFVDDVSHIRAGNAFREGGAFDQAADSYRQALALNPTNAAALANLGTVLSDLNRLPEAAEALNKSLALAPANATALFNLSVVLAKQNDFDGAIRCCAEAVRLDPGSSSAQSNLGLFLFEKGRWTRPFPISPKRSGSTRRRTPPSSRWGGSCAQGPPRRPSPATRRR